MPEQTKIKTEQKEIPSFLLLSSIKPEDVEGELYSPKLEDRLKTYRRYESELWEALEEHEGMDELSTAQKIAKLHFLETAHKLQNASEKGKPLWSERFNRAIEEIYGRPNRQEAIEIANNELTLLKGAEDSSVYKLYESVTKEASPFEDEEQVAEKLNSKEMIELRSAFLDKFDYIFEVLEVHKHQGVYEIEEVRNIFEEILDRLRKKDSQEWANWSIVDRGGRSLAVTASEKVIKVPERRGPIKDYKTLVSRVAHELLVHAFRAKKGYELEDGNLAKGMPDYLNAEEGLGIFLEHVVSGEIPERARDRYFDISLAAGIIGGEPMPRDVLYGFVVNRSILRKKLQGEEIDSKTQKEIKAKANTHVTRIFRGGTGVRYKNDDGELVQPVFIKDIVYHSGSVLIEQFIKSSLKKGKEYPEIIDYLLLGKFDPSNSEHRDYISQYTDF